MEIAILMAAGIGSRMLPLTEKIPKPLIAVRGTPLIETVINSLERRRIEEIYVVVGYLKEQFKYLETKYDNLTLVENEEYMSKNNISSIYAVSNVLGSSDCFICETDLYVSDKTIFECELDQSCYFGLMKKGYSDDWIFEMSDNRIMKIKKGGTDTYNMVGISYFKQKDAIKIRDAVTAMYKFQGHENLFWDEVVDTRLEDINLGIHEVQENQIIEIDTPEELHKINDEGK